MDSGASIPLSRCAAEVKAAARQATGERKRKYPGVKTAKSETDPAVVLKKKPRKKPKKQTVVPVVVPEQLFAHDDGQKVFQIIYLTIPACQTPIKARNNGRSILPGERESDDSRGAEEGDEDGAENRVVPIARDVSAPKASLLEKRVNPATGDGRGHKHINTVPLKTTSFFLDPWTPATDGQLRQWAGSLFESQDAYE